MRTLSLIAASDLRLKGTSGLLLRKQCDANHHCGNETVSNHVEEIGFRVLCHFLLQCCPMKPIVARDCGDNLPSLGLKHAFCGGWSLFGRVLTVSLRDYSQILWGMSPLPLLRALVATLLPCFDQTQTRR